MEEILFMLEQYVLEAGVWGPIVYVLAMVIAIVVSPIPSSPLAVFAGTVFGTWYAFGLTMLGAMLGALVAFYIARVFGRPVVLKMVPDKELIAIEKRFSEKHVVLTIFLSRLLPLPFFDAVSYVAGLSHVSVRGFIFASFFGLIPLVFLFSYFGDAFSDNPLALGLLVGITLLIFFIFLWVFRRNGKGRVDGKR